MRSVVLLLGVLLGGCLSGPPAPVEESTVEARPEAPVEALSAPGPVSATPPGDYWTWYPIAKGEGDELRWFKDPHLGVLFRQTGCGFFSWGRGGEWATRLEIGRPAE